MRGHRWCGLLCRTAILILYSPFPLEDSMDEQRKYTIPFAATILATRKLSDRDLKPWLRAAANTDAIQKAEQILEQIAERCRKKETA